MAAALPQSGIKSNKIQMLSCRQTPNYSTRSRCPANVYVFQCKHKHIRTHSPKRTRIHICVAVGCLSACRMIDLYALWIINGRGQVNWSDFVRLGSFIIETLLEGDTNGQRCMCAWGKISSQLDIDSSFLWQQKSSQHDFYTVLNL